MSKTVLVVDDELDILKIVSFRLKQAGYEVLTAEDGKEGLDLLRKERAGLVLLDIAMPVMDGYELCRIIKSDEALKKIPVVFLTASQPTSIEKKTKEYNADAFLIKPFESGELLATVRKFAG